ncbi:pur operon repressor [Alicyclobacillus macrosporangiidus]|uniref:pur operon repressor n=1 Tax=Alicyclobacillus macrosporangiidus TaxID=392015 RepID=UPI000555C4E1
MDVRRSERLIRVTKNLLDQPNRALSLSELAERLEAAKSSLSEDVALVRSVLERDGSGVVWSIAGAAGGVKYQVRVPPAQREAFLQAIVARLSDPSRILPGGFLYMSDVLGDPDVLDLAGRLFAEAFADREIQVVVTVETKGIPLAVSAARYLHVPVAVVRRDHRVTEGASVSIHYISGSERRIQTMSMSKRAMPQRARALVVDDFMKAGATAKGVVNLLAEFEAQVAGVAVFVATQEPAEKLVPEYVSLFTLGPLQEGEGVILTPALPVHS